MNLELFVINILLTVIITFFLFKKNDKNKKKWIVDALLSVLLSLGLELLIFSLYRKEISLETSIISSIFSFYLSYSLLNDTLNIKTLIKTFATLLIFFGGSIFQIIPISLFNITSEVMTNELSIYLTLFSDLCTAQVLIFIYYDDLKRGIIKAKRDFNSFFDTSCKYWVMGFIGMVISNLCIGLLFPDAVASNENSVQSMISVSPFIMFLCAGVLAPIIEELTFRQAFKNIISNKWLYILTSGIIFGGMHVIFSYSSLIDLIYIVPYSILGVAFAYMTTKTDNVLSSMMMHFIHNSTIIGFSILTGMILL